MNDAWDPTEDLEPLDDASLGLLSAFRDASGPDDDAQARMLAGLRARIDAEDDAAAEPATAVPTAAEPRATTSRRRTAAVAVLAFAAGVALTLALPSSPQPQSSTVAQAPRERAPRVATAAPGTTAMPSPSQRPLDQALAPPAAELSWPLADVDLQEPAVADLLADTPRPPSESQRSEVQPSPRDPQQDPQPNEPGARRGAGTSATRSPSAPLQPGNGARPSGAPQRPGAWAPTLPSGASPANIGAAARNPALGSNPSQRTSPSQTTPSTSPDRSQPSNDQTEPSSPNDKSDKEPPDEQPDEQPEDEQPDDEEVCADQHEACVADADEYCGESSEGCLPIYDFCEARALKCLGEVLPPSPFPDDPYDEDPEEHEPDDCHHYYDMCITEAETICILEKVPPHECDFLRWDCEDMFAECQGSLPPDPYWP